MADTRNKALTPNSSDEDLKEDSGISVQTS